MGFLDFEENYKPRYMPPKYKGRANAEQEEDRLGELNNYDRPKVAEDFSDSPHLNTL